MQIELWSQIFKEFQQVKEVSVDSSAGRLDIIIDGHNEILHVTSKELDESLHEYSSYPHEVVKSFLKRHGIIIYYGNTLVGFFDIQAYSSFVESVGMLEAINKIPYCLTSIKGMANTKFFSIRFDHWILSDSIIVVVDTKQYPLYFKSVLWFIQTCSMIMRISMQNRFPLRGAIGGGDFYNDGEIMVSTGLIDAAKYEKEQEWFGAVLTPKACEVIKNAEIDLLSPDFNSCVRHGGIPWKQDSRYANREASREMYYIKPHMVDIDARANWEALFIPSYFDKRAQSKIDNSYCLYAEA